MKTEEDLVTKQLLKASYNSRIQNYSVHHQFQDREAKLRPSDRSNESRHYGKMDLDIWKYEGVRDWFNKYSIDKPEEPWSAAKSGYTFARDDSIKRW